MEDFQRCQEAVTAPACLLKVTVSMHLQPLAVELVTLAVVAGLLALEDKLTKALVLE
ncbi:hypothetical protein NVV94_24380 [Pseudomonas sp. LS1212]|uniref:hypothetical protein n=1 Tax=Pseudomonas sp. LS1212 TaxID=2972478 RepID=UPI00215D22AD|nr:hypothetical protein [Pseudomonas sp. LS1212]UVJ43637.1 hypothetical protein NVV94_24380 [Pseudomonas sp. LS1212]